MIACTIQQQEVENNQALWQVLYLLGKDLPLQTGVLRQAWQSGCNWEVEIFALAIISCASRVAFTGLLRLRAG